MKRESMARLLAPAAPPCFSARDQWLEYLAEHAKETRVEQEPGPLIFSRVGVTLDTDAALHTAPRGFNVALILVKGRKVTFNFSMNYCSDCSTEYRREMQKQNRCNPNHLRDLFMIGDGT